MRTSTGGGAATTRLAVASESAAIAATAVAGTSYAPHATAYGAAAADVAAYPTLTPTCRGLSLLSKGSRNIHSLPPN